MDVCFRMLLMPYGLPFSWLHLALFKTVELGAMEGAGATLRAPGMHLHASTAPATVRQFNEAISACRRQGRWQEALALLGETWLHHSTQAASQFSKEVLLFWHGGAVCSVRSCNCKG